MDGPIEQNARPAFEGILSELDLACEGGPDSVLEALCFPARGWIAPFDGAAELLAFIARRRWSAAVLSNAAVRSGTLYARDFANLRWGSDGLLFFSSVDIGYRKPHPTMFEAALASLRVFPQEVVMIGDSEGNDVEPAKRQGMRAIRVAIESELDATIADAGAKSLAEVAQILEGWSA